MSDNADSLQGLSKLGIVPTLQGDQKDNILKGTDARDVIAGLKGHDQLSGEGAADVLHGGSGDDMLSGDRMNSFDNGRDVDEIYGGTGNDMIFSGFGDIVDGGDGFDTVALSYVGATAGINGDTRTLHTGQPLTPGGGTFKNVERFSDIALTSYDDKMVIGDQSDPAVVRAWDGNDHLIGQEMSITMYGGNGNDMLVGSTANDVLYGEAGNDTLMGHLGNDELWGGSGADRFIITDFKNVSNIKDFEHSSDKIDVGSLDANSKIAGDQAFDFVGGGNFTGIAGQLRVVQTSSATYDVQGDVNGDGVADFLIHLGSGVAPTQSDFML
ncbi:calcium-binding protein [Sphingomonas piscis]|uniref:Calcium-binding protein n=1 Tax=Sphingomonas piscis TaxID=2714943 RepID=A0A6G7YQW5_9SPHN|nr:calcium-binding protein [Sphingomonas piscis]QIK79129.1 calcium-binding protein [Sphingomonas piscis]